MTNTQTQQRIEAVRKCASRAKDQKMKVYWYNVEWRLRNPEKLRA